MKPVAGCSIISSFLFSLQKRSGSESGKGRLLSYGSGDLLSRFFSACRLCPTRPREACSCFYLLSPGQSFRVDPALPLRSSDLGVGRPAGGSSDLDRSGLDLAYLSLLTSLSPSVTESGQGDFQAVKLQTPARIAVCSHPHSGTWPSINLFLAFSNNRDNEVIRLCSLAHIPQL
jgi:hypothetical protein